MARALTCNADLLLMDEPLSALDALLREEMQDMLKRCWQQQGYAQVLVTHSIEEAVYLGQRVFVMTSRPGRVGFTLENAECVQDGWRNEPLFYERCRELRRVLKELAGEECVLAGQTSEGSGASETPETPETPETSVPPSVQGSDQEEVRHA